MSTRVEYPANVREFARRLHERQGLTAHAICKRLAARGFTPDYNTVRCWIDDDYAEARRESTRLAMRRRSGRSHGRGRRRLELWAARWERMQELRGLRLSYRAIAAVMSNDFEGVELDAEQVRSMLRGRVAESRKRELLGAS